MFTSGGTEANALALTPGLRRASGAPANRLLVSAIEHASVLAGGRFAPDAIGTIGVTGAGVLDLARLRAMLESGPPALVSVMLANNETGALQPVAEAAALVHAAGGVLHVDAIQAFGKSAVWHRQPECRSVDAVRAQGGRPQGRGCARLWPRGCSGWSHCCAVAVRNWDAGRERRMSRGLLVLARPRAAASVALEADALRLEGQRHRLENGLRETSGIIVFSDDVPRLPNTTLFTVPGLRAETAVIGFDLAGIAVSSGSACSSGKVQPSHVLAAMGAGPEIAKGAVRLSLGWSTSDADIDRCLEAWRKLCRYLT